LVTTQVLENATAPKDWDRGQNTTWRDRTVFYDPVRDQGARWQGALHVRSQPPKFESWPCASRPGKPCAGPKAAVQAEYDAYFRTMASSELWRCAVEHAAAVASEMPGGGPAKLFLATDSDGLCHAAHVLEPRISCMNATPAHMTKQTATKLHEDHDLDSHHAALLDWFFLARTRWLSQSIRRESNHRGLCDRGAPRLKNHRVDAPGRSFYGWALAASGLVPLPADAPRATCACGVDSTSISVTPPGERNRSAPSEGSRPVAPPGEGDRPLPLGR